MTPDMCRLLDRAAELVRQEQESFLDLECEDSGLRDKVAARLRYSEEAEALFERAIGGVAVSWRRTQAPSPGARIGNYRLVSLIGAGGMGEVFLAERVDGEIQQKVAMKFLRPIGQEPGWRQRFLLERQMLASLHHPSIVSVMDAGHTDDGHPSLVMEHVEGISIDRYAEAISVRARLELLIRVCEGVAHAHRCLIIHRDLKPSNILVDAAGRPKLLDFGIAKLAGETGEATKPAERIMTPQYASPEQLRGEAQTTATDVYSLGAVLFKLLTGIAPSDLPEGGFVPASRLNPETPLDVDYVTAKALRPEPEERYASVDELAADLKAVLERRPVRARAGDRWYRLRKSASRAWIPLTAGLLTIGGLAGGLCVADRQRRLAERRFDDVRQLANKLYDIDAQVAQLAGSSKTRQLIVDTSLEYLKRLTADVRLEPGLAVELGTAYMRVARVQGVNISPNLGQTIPAEQTEQRAQTLIETALAAQPRNRAALLRASQIAHDRMILAGDRELAEDALHFAAVSIERLNRYLSSGPVLSAASDRKEAQQVIITLINVANRYMKAGRYAEAVQIATRAIDIAHATNWPAQAGAALPIVAMSHRAKGELGEALAAVRESVRLLKPEDGQRFTGRMQSYGLALIREGQILAEDEAISLNQTDEAVKCYERALEIGMEYAKRDANDFQSQHRVFLAETKLAGILRHTDPARAGRLYDDALRRLTATTANAGAPRNEIETLAASAQLLIRLGRRREAQERLDAAMARLRSLKQYPAEHIEIGSPAADTLRALAEYDVSGGNFGRAAARYHELLRLVGAGDAGFQTTLEHAVKLTALYAGAQRAFRGSGDARSAAMLAARSAEMWRDWSRRLPNNAFVRRLPSLKPEVQLQRTSRAGGAS